MGVDKILFLLKNNISPTYVSVDIIIFSFPLSGGKKIINLSLPLQKEK